MNATRTITDPIYGRVNITEPVLIELLRSKALKRLKDIHQQGANYFFWPEADTMNRFDHCVGVMLLIRKLGGSLKEQVAGLLHDIGHSAFSHVLDYLIDNRQHEAHEQFTQQFLKNTDIPKILRRHGFDQKQIFEHRNFSILEQSSPALCADRIDYFLRDAIGYGVLTKDQTRKILIKLANNQNAIVTTDRAIAKLMAETYLEMDREYWATSRNSLAINYAVVEIIRRALGLGAIDFEDLWRYSDRELINYLKNLDDPEINHWFEVLHPEVMILEDSNHYDVRVYPKIRLLDPGVLKNGEVKKLSELDPDFADQLRDARDFPDELFLRFST